MQVFKIVTTVLQVLWILTMILILATKQNNDKMTYTVIGLFTATSIVSIASIWL